MTSAINPSTISTTFPVAGQDNDSQGFRSNFAAIVADFATAASEISALQAVTIANADLATQSQPVVNNLLGSTLSNGLYQQFSGTLYSASGVASTANIDLSVGAVQKFTLSGNATLTFINWPAYPATSVFSEAIILLASDTNGVWTPTWATTNGSIKYDTSFPAALSVGGESVGTVSVTSAGSGYTSAVSVGFSGGNPQTGYTSPSATPSYTIVSASVAEMAASSISITGITNNAGSGTSVIFTFTSQFSGTNNVIPFTNTQSVLISGVSPSAYNGIWVVTGCTTTSVTVTCPATANYSSGGTIQGGIAGSGYAVGDIVSVVGYPNTYLTVATIATTFPAQITGGQSAIGNIPASYFSLLSVGMPISGNTIPLGTQINTINAVSNGIFSIVMGNSGGTSVNASGSVQQTVTVTYTSTTGPIGTFSGVPCGTFTNPLSAALYQIQTITGVGSGARPIISCGVGALTLTSPGNGYTSTPPTISITSGGGLNAQGLAVLTSGTSSKTKVIQAWTVNAGTTVNLRYLGQY
jgi:hypothetical protein